MCSLRGRSSCVCSELTSQPRRKFEPGTQRFELHKKAQASLNAGLDLKVAVQLPPGEEQNDWVAVHVVDFFNRINLIYGTISDYCTEQSCPVMSGGPKYEYRWQDEHKYRKPTALSAPQYMNLLMDWIEVQINNEDIFPTNVGGAVAGVSRCADSVVKLFQAPEKLQSSSRVLKYAELWQIPSGVMDTSRKAKLSPGSKNKRLLLEKSVSDMTLE
ncbi:mob kinase activator 3a [Limosa lapponica baueri]|uniref:Mob kinase activator 3a n=1 Tax=Limosa lapponica baueri TaxID=1758121 RepID=A0A2I0T4B7_LIMLA|nr:mob kinase activator 3a [Limosa lapponica baueri]